MATTVISKSSLNVSVAVGVVDAGGGPGVLHTVPGSSYAILKAYFNIAASTTATLYVSGIPVFIVKADAGGAITATGGTSQILLEAISNDIYVGPGQSVSFTYTNPVIPNVSICGVQFINT